MSKIIACDFDGTLVTDRYPEIGYPYPTIIDELKKRKAQGDKIILWTCRTGEYLDKAVAWCREQGIEFDAINDNVQEIQTKYNNNARKVYADEYWDDHNVDVIKFGFYPLVK